MWLMKATNSYSVEGRGGRWKGEGDSSKHTLYVICICKSGWASGSHDSLTPSALTSRAVSVLCSSHRCLPALSGHLHRIQLIGMAEQPISCPLQVPILKCGVTHSQLLPIQPTIPAYPHPAHCSTLTLLPPTTPPPPFAEALSRLGPY